MNVNYLLEALEVRQSILYNLDDPNRATDLAHRRNMYVNATPNKDCNCNLQSYTVGRHIGHSLQLTMRNCLLEHNGQNLDTADTIPYETMQDTNWGDTFAN